jgi:hypothetical protein
MSHNDGGKALMAFFGNNKKGPSYVAANNKKDLQTSTLNTDADLHARENTDVWQLMRGKNYETPVKVGDDDVHYEFTDFVMRTALYHNQLDNRQHRGHHTIEKVKKDVQDTLNAPFNVAGNLDHLAAVLSATENAKTIGVTVAGAGDVIPNTPHKYFTMMLLAAAGAASRVANKTFSENIYSTPGLTLHVPKDVAGMLAGAVNITNGSDKVTTIDEMLERLIKGDGGKGVCLVSLFPDLLDPVAGGAPALDATMERTLKLQLKQLLMNLASGKDVNALNNTNTYTTAYKNSELADNILAKHVLKQKNKHELGGHTGFITVNQDAPNKIYNDIYVVGWDKLSPSTRAYYSANMSLLRNTGAKWEEVSSDSYGKLAGMVPTNMRLNLKTVDNDKNVFGEALPLIPANTKVWYTDKNLSQPVSVQTPSKTFLRDLYDGIVRGGVHNAQHVVNVGGVAVKVPAYNDLLQENDTWSLNPAIVVGDVLTKACAVTKAGEGKSTFSTQKVDAFTELWNMQGQNKWFRDADGNLFTYDEKGVRQKCDEDFRDEHNRLKPFSCKSKVFNVGTEDECRHKVAKCLTTEPENLDKCLAELADEDMFDTAKIELSQMHPGIAKQILKVFQVGKSDPPRFDAMYDMRIIEPQPYEDWEANVLNNSGKIDSKVSNIIKKNNSLKQYLKGVIAFVRANPAILNEDFRIHGSVLRESSLKVTRDQNDYMAGLNMHWHRVPLPNTVEDMAFGSRLLLAGSQAFGPQVESLNPLAQFTHDSIFQSGGGMDSNSYLNMTGGGASPYNQSVFDTLSQKIQNLFSDLQRGGLYIQPTDKKRIEEIIKTMTKTEHKINELIRVFRIIANMQKFVKSVGQGKNSPHASTGGKRPISIERAMSYKDLLEWLHKNAGEYEFNIYRNINFMNSSEIELLDTYNDLVNSMVVENGQKYSNM